jgi:casein kinase 1
VALYFLRGFLPWQGLQAPSRLEKERLVLERKQTISVAELCDGLPVEFATYMNYIRELNGQDKPDYKYLRNLFDRLFRRKGFEHDNVFDWTVREFERLSNVSQQRVVSRANVVKQKTQQDSAGRRDRKRRRRTRANAKE